MIISAHAIIAITVRTAVTAQWIESCLNLAKSRWFWSLYFLVIMLFAKLAFLNISFPRLTVIDRHSRSLTAVIISFK